MTDLSLTMLGTLLGFALLPLEFVCLDWAIERLDRWRHRNDPPPRSFTFRSAIDSEALQTLYANAYRPPRRRPRTSLRIDPPDLLTERNH